RAVVADTAATAATALRTAEGRRTAVRAESTEVAFLFPWQEVRYAGVGRGLYETEPVYREALDRCAELAMPHLGRDLRSVVHAAPRADLRRRPLGTDVDHPALFAMEYALARLWMSRGVRPGSMLGHSLGEYVAACLSGVFSLEDAVAVVCARGRLAQDTPQGAMSVVGTGEELAATTAAEHGLSLAAVNAHDQCVLSGDPEAVEAAEGVLARAGVRSLRLPADRAFNSPLMDSVLEEYRSVIAGVRLGEPRVPFCSNLTGTWITPGQATDPDYWVRHLRETVRFDACQESVLRTEDRIFLEAGPGTALTWLIRRWAGDDERALATFPVAGTPPEDEPLHALRAAASLWEAGAELDWSALRGAARCSRVPLPAHPFEGERFRLGGGPVRPAAPLSRDTAPDTTAPEAGTPDAGAHRRAGQAPPAASGSRGEGGPPPGGYRRPELRVPYSAPRSEMEHTVAGLWSRILGYADVGVHDDFVDLGGDSLVSVELAAQLERRFSVDVPVELMFQHPTVADQAEIVERLIAAAPGATDESAGDTSGGVIR
ncbi:acyltransferase domain-containing protein, partial [Streptomyces sp. JJ36]|uniref:acyltransferase domain-containing protein n=1 Tax=Streptomyces sp. JJ36 TaxID=2736645 RepID=UPI001F326FDE